MFKKKILVVTELLLVILLAGCQTVKGLGEDVQAGGRAVSGAAQDVQQKM